MSMYDYAIKAAFDDAKRDNYQHPLELDPDVVAAECSDLIDIVDGLISADDVILANEGDDVEEERMAMVMREAFVRAFEAGLAVGLEAGEEEIEVRVRLDRETIAGLVQQALAGNNSLKE